MVSPDNLIVIYKELADAHERRGQPQMRDRFLILAADAALQAGRSAEADLLLARLLRANPHHMLRPFPSFAEAMASPDIQNYVGELRRAHPPQQAEEEFDALRAARGPMGPHRPTRALPPTAPVVDLDDSPLAGTGREPLKVYRIQDEIEPPPAPAPPPQRAPRPTPARTPVTPPRMPPRSAPPPPRPREIDPEPAPLPPPSPTDGEEAAQGTWVSTGLFVLLLAAGVVLAGWTFLRPFLAQG
jgi:hypothetical protein